MATKVLLKPYELADAYALKTLYDYVGECAPEFNCMVDHDEYLTGAHKVLKSMRKTPKGQYWRNIKNAVRVHSDMTHPSPNARTLEVDISILKNCQIPPTLEDRLKLRKHYQIPSEKPVLVIGHSRMFDSEIKLLQDVNRLATTIIVGVCDEGDFAKSEALFRERRRLKGKPIDKSRLRFVKTRGELRDYYALADVAVNAHNLFISSNEMHNFVEAVQGGPLFMVRPEKIQFGYDSLVRRNAIIECEEGFVSKRVSHFIRNFSNNYAHQRQVSEHLTICRKQYLPTIKEYMKFAFQGKDKPRANMKVETAHGPDNQNVTRITHPKTNWGREIYLGDN